MAYVIAEPCIGTKDTACVDVCPVDCIHPRKDRTCVRGRDAAVYPPHRMHRLWGLRSCLPVTAISRSKIFRKSGIVSRQSTPIGTQNRESSAGLIRHSLYFWIRAPRPVSGALFLSCHSEKSTLTFEQR